MRKAIGPRKIYGYKWYLNDKLVATSAQLFTTRQAVWLFMQESVHHICDQIEDDKPKRSGFVWNCNFDPENANSCDSAAEFSKCMKTYERIQYMVGFGGVDKIMARSWSGINPLEINCPYQIEWFIVPYNYIDR